MSIKSSRLTTWFSLLALTLSFGVTLPAQASDCADGFSFTETDYMSACHPDNHNGWSTAAYDSIVDLANLEQPLLTVVNDDGTQLDLAVMQVEGNRKLKIVLKEDYFTETGELPDNMNFDDGTKYFSGKRIGIYSVTQGDNVDRTYFYLDKGDTTSYLYILELKGVKGEDNFDTIKTTGKSVVLGESMAE